MIRPPTSRSPSFIVGILFIVLALILFAMLAFNVVIPGIDPITTLDFRLANALHDAMTPFAVDVMKIVTMLGNEASYLLTVLVIVWYLAQRQWKPIALWLIVVLGGGAVNSIVKALVHRDRPVFVPAFVTEAGYSFPSGHTQGAMLAFGCLAYLLASATPRRWLRAVIVIVCMLIVATVGFTRMALGVHYLSDVLGGAALGGAWLILSLLIYTRAQRRGAATTPNRETSRSVPGGRSA